MILTLLILEYTFAFLTKRVSYTDYGMFTSIGYRYKKLCLKWLSINVVIEIVSNLIEPM